MAGGQWGRFQLFEKTLVSDPSDPNDSSKPFQFLLDVDLTACASGRGHLYFGGFIHIANRVFQMNSFSAHDGPITHIRPLKQRNVLITIGEEGSGADLGPVLKIWNMDKTGTNKGPACLRTIKISHNGRAFPVNVMEVLENLSHLVVGLANGILLSYRGDILRERFLSKPKVLLEADSPITGLGFKQQGREIYLFVVTLARIYSVHTTGKDQKDTLDEQGCSIRCVSQPENENHIVLARQEAVYFYDENGRGPCLAFEGDKTLLSWFRGYMVVVGQDKKSITQSQGTTATGATNTALRPVQNHLVSIYDIRNKLIAFQGAFIDVQFVVNEWGSVFVITAERKMYRIEEKDTSTKLEMLFKKDMYSLAIGLAESQKFDPSFIVEIHRKYGDHLYAKTDYDGAIAQYIETIGRLEPSYVIRKFLDAQRIRNLTMYLQKLHEKGLAGSDHTTLLLNCYTKLKDTERLSEFLRTDRELIFDVETAIKVCRQAGFHEHALYLAKKFEDYDAYMLTQIEDIKNYKDALAYLASIPFVEARALLKKYGKLLVDNLPEESTKLFIKICAEKLSKKTESGDSLVQPEEFIPLFVNQSKWLCHFLEVIVSKKPDSPSIIFDTLLELYLANEPDATIRKQNLDKAFNLIQLPDAKFDLEHAMILFRMHDFKAGVLHLYEKMGLYKDILQHHMDNDEYALLLSTVKKFGADNPQLWIEALSYFCQKDTDCRKEVSEILAFIESKSILPPIQVVQILSQNSTVTLSVIKDYIIRTITNENQQIAEDQRLIKSYREETEKLQQEIKEIKSGARVFQLSKCAYCATPLELPTVHFICKHSYHQRCLGTEKGCIKCAPEYRSLIEIRQAQEASAANYNQFLRQLDGAEDGFSVIADYFGRNVFRKTEVLKPNNTR